MRSMVKKKKTLHYIFADKHKSYIRNCKNNVFNFAEGAVRAGKTIDNVLAFSIELMKTPDRIHLATGSTVGNAKLNIGDCNGFGLEYIFRGQCRWTKFKDNEALYIKGPSTNYRERIIIFAGAGKADSFKRIRGNSYGMWIATEINLHHEETIREAFNRTAASKHRKFFWDLNPDHPKHLIYTNYIDKYRNNPKLKVNYEHFTLDDNLSLPPERIEEIKEQYDPATVWYQRDILGRRMVAEGLIYRLFADNSKKYLIKQVPNLKYLNIGVDIGGNQSKHTFVATGITVDLKLIALASEKYEPDDSDTLRQQFLNFVLKIIKQYGQVTTIYSESAEQVFKRDFQKILLDNNINIAVKNSIKNEINDRIRIVNKLIYQGRFYYTKDCETLAEALEMAIWDDKKIEPIRLDDGTSDIDTLDAFEYSFEKFIKLLNQ